MCICSIKINPRSRSGCYFNYLQLHFNFQFLSVVIHGEVRQSMSRQSNYLKENNYMTCMYPSCLSSVGMD